MNGKRVREFNVDKSLFERMRKPDRRKHPRFTTSFIAELGVGAIRRSVVVGDISSGGAMIEDANDLWLGQQIALKANKFNVQGEIRWKSEGLCGVAFKMVVDPLDIIQANEGKIEKLWDEAATVAPPNSEFS